MSKMIKCKTCGVDIAKSAKSCPGCGAKNKKPFYTRWWFILIAIFIIIGALGGNKGSNESTTASKNESTPVTTAKDESSSSVDSDTKINYDNFLSIQMGMSYDQVKGILGDGNETSSSDISGIKTIMYTWKGKGIDNISVTIQNDAVTNKAQVGLMDMNAEITMDKYNQVQNGMTYEQVKEILGEGQILSETKIMDVTSIMYEYINKDGSNANFTFDASGMSMKSQFNLK